MSGLNFFSKSICQHSEDNSLRGCSLNIIVISIACELLSGRVIFGIEQFLKIKLQKSSLIVPSPMGHMHDNIAEVELFHDYLKQAQNSMSEAEFFFHGTDHKSALNIVHEGIDVKASKCGRDFSDGNGFYLSTDFEKTQRKYFTNPEYVHLYKLSAFRQGALNGCPLPSSHSSYS